jgi:hypothetical protein
MDLTNQKPSFCLAASEHIRELVRLQIEDPDGEKVRYLYLLEWRRTLH